MKPLAAALGCLALAVAAGFLLRSESVPVRTSRSTASAEATSAATQPAPSKLDTFQKAKASRSWRDVRAMKAAPHDVESLLRDPRVLLAAELLEEASLTNEQREILLRRLETLETEDRALHLRLLARFGGGARVAAVLRDDPARESKRDAALALAAWGAEADLVLEPGLTGVYASLALEKMSKRGAIGLSDARRVEIRELLERELVAGESHEALAVLASVRETDEASVLVGYVRGPGPLTLRRKALQLFGERGMPEDLEKLPSVDPDLEADYRIARREIESRAR